ncbi:MAG: hypothetical protein WEB06_00635 [Actinomycetota bacterium]
MRRKLIAVAITISAMAAFFAPQASHAGPWDQIPLLPGDFVLEITGSVAGSSGLSCLSVDVRTEWFAGILDVTLYDLLEPTVTPVIQVDLMYEVSGQAKTIPGVYRQSHSFDRAGEALDLHLQGWGIPSDAEFTPDWFCTLRVTVDADNEHAESNESNNTDQKAALLLG